VDENDKLARYDSEDNDQPVSFDGHRWLTFAIGAVVMSASHMEVTVGTLYASLLHSDIAATVAYGWAVERGSVNSPRMVVRYRRYGKKTQKGLMLLASSCLEVSDELNELAASIRELR
jgi:hypothetical protein